MTNLFFVGTVVKAQGIKGEVKIKSDAGSLALVRGHKTLFLNETSAAVQQMRISGDFAFVLFSGLSDRNQAETLVGKDVFADKSKIILIDDNYYISDVVGCRVCLTDGREIGIADGILQNGKSADVVIVKGEREVMFPFLKDLISSLDTEAKILTLDAKRFDEVSVYED